MTPEPLIEIENLSLSFKVEGRRQAAVRDFSLKLYANEVFGLVGKSGSGKSTILFAIMNYLAQNAVVELGIVRYRGMDLLRADRSALDQVRGRRIAMVYQDPASVLNPAMRAGPQIAEVLRQHLGMDERQARERTHELLAQVQFDNPEATYAAYPHELSGGMRQRVMIAMALCCEPDVLLMDEPTTALDVIVQARILDLVADLHRKIHSAILFVSHNLAAMGQIADRIGVLYAGELMERGSAHQILRHSRNPYTRALLAAVPQLDARDLPHGIAGTTDKSIDRFSRCVFATRCRFTETVCRTVRPALLQIEEAGHISRCHFAAQPARIAIDPEAHIGVHRTTEGIQIPLLEVSDLTVEYRTATGLLGIGGRQILRAVRDVSFSLPRQRILAVVGESGSGKSTLARAILKLVSTARGQIKFNGADIYSLNRQQLRAFRRNVQIVFQNPSSSLNPRRTVAELIERPLVVAGINRRERGERVLDALDAVGLPRNFRNRLPQQLSGGEQQRVALARTFVVDPLLVILDEPTTALDVSVQATILELLMAQKERTSCAYLLISHDLAVVRQIADDVIVLRDGAVQESGPVERVFVAPAHPYTRALLEAVPSLPLNDC